MQENLKEKVKFLLKTAQIGSSKDFTADEKRCVFSHFEPYGLSEATCRNRFFRDGFREWELTGIIGCIQTFESGYPEVAGIVAEAEKVTLDTPIDDVRDIVGRYYEALPKKKGFFDYMYERGLSTTSVTSHFHNSALFQPWELYGVRRIFETFDTANNSSLLTPDS